MARKVCVTLDDIHWTPSPRLRAIIQHLREHEDEITRIATGKLVYNLAPGSVKPAYECVGDQIQVVAS